MRLDSANAEPNNSSCVDDASQVYGWWVNDPVCVSGHRSNCEESVKEGAREVWRETATKAKS